MRMLGLVLLIALATRPASADDISAEAGAATAGVLAPYSSGAGPTATADPQILARALAILDQEGILKAAAPPKPSQPVIPNLAKALLLGNRAPEFMPELAAIETAALQRDSKAAGDEIRSLYAKMGRKVPDDAAIDGLVDAAFSANAPEPRPSERHVLDRPDYTIITENEPAAGRARVEVIDKKSANGEPTRTELVADQVAKPTADGKDLTTAYRPAGSETMTRSEADALRPKLNGRWRDQSGDEWEISGEGQAIRLINLSSGTHLDYDGTFNLGRIEASHLIRNPDDMGGDLPGGIRSQLAAMSISFRLSLTAAKDASKIDGSWISQHVTYSQMSMEVTKVHDPFATREALTRADVKTAEGAAAGLAP